MVLRRNSSKSRTDRGDRSENRSSSKRGRSKGKFKYKKRSGENMREHARQRGGDRDGFTSGNIKIYSVRDGSNSIRVLPPTWEDAEHFGYEMWVNYSIGADNNQYLSLSKMYDEDDPVAEEYAAAMDDGDTEYADQLKAKRRFGIWLIDRKDEKEGPQFWAVPWTFDRDMCAAASDEDTNEVLDIDDPDEGYDVKFTREGTGNDIKKKKYIGVKVARHSSPISENERKQGEWLDYIQENPVPDILVKHDYDHIAKSFAGDKRVSKDDEEEEERGSRGRRSSSSRSEPEPDDELDWHEIHDMSLRQLEHLIRDEDLDIDADDYDEEEELADAICEELDVEEEEEDEPSPRRSSRGRKSSSRSSSRRSSKDEDEEDDEPRGSRSRMRRMRR